MRFSTPTPAFSAAFNLAAAVAPPRTPKPILQNILFNATDRTLLATDGDVSIRVVVPELTATEPGSCLLPVQTSSKILRELQASTFDVEANNGDGIQITTNSATFHLPGSDPAEFPAVHGWDSQQFLSVDAADLRSAIERTVFATDQESSRYALGGVLFEPGDGCLTLVATDSRRLSVVQIPKALGDLTLPPNVHPVVPVKALQALLKALPDNTAEIRCAFSANEASFLAGDVTLHTRLVEGRFPRWRDVVPKDAKICVPLLAGPLLQLVRQAVIFTSIENRGVDWEFAKGKLTLHSLAAEQGESRVDMPIDFRGTLTLRLDPRFVADFLKTLAAETQVTIRLTDSESAMLFETDHSRYVIMPLEQK